MCKNNNLTDDKMLKLASEDRPIQRDEIGIEAPSTKDGMQVLNEGFNFLQFNDQSTLFGKMRKNYKHINGKTYEAFPPK